MSNLYASLHVTPRKKRVYASDDEDDVLTPKRNRYSVRTPPATRKKPAPKRVQALPLHLARYQSLQSSLHHALAHSLATAAVCPSESGVVPNILNNYTLTSAAGLSKTCTMDDIRRLCWLWEWDGKNLPVEEDEGENPFLEDGDRPDSTRQWSRGANGLVITPTTYLPKAGGKRAQAYGIGIEVEMDIDKEMVGGMAAVARWTAGGESRLKSLEDKLLRWMELHADSETVPNIPLANLPPLAPPPQKQSALTQRLVSLSPKSPKSATPPSFEAPPSPSRSGPAKSRMTPSKRGVPEFAIPFPITPTSLHRTKPNRTITSSPAKATVPPASTVSRIPFPSTPVKAKASFPATPTTVRTTRIMPATPQTPRTSTISFPSDSSRPSTPVHQRGSEAVTAPETPSTSRRAALAERLRRKSEVQAEATPSRARISTTHRMTRDELLKLSQEETRRRCLLGRLGGVAESIWMFFSSPSNSSTLNATPRKRRTLPTAEVITAILKSSPVPISSAEAQESISMLTKMCPFFLKEFDVGGEEWLEIPATVGGSQPSAPASPGRRLNGAADSDEEVRQLSPKRVKKEMGGLRQVRERIKRELDATE